MKKFLLLFLFSTILLSNSIAQNNYKDNIVDDISLYAGVYEGNLDISLCCDNYQTGFGTIVFYYDGASLKCLYDGVILENLKQDKNILKYSNDYMDGIIFGKFVKDKEDGFLYYFEETDEHPIGSTSFLKKIDGPEAAGKIYLDAERDLNEFKEFEMVFRKAFSNKNVNEIISIINLPFYDKRENWANPVEYTKENDLKGLVKTMLKANLYENSFKYQNTNEDFGGLYTIQGDTMFLYFTKVGSKFKMVYITNVFG